MAMATSAKNHRTTCVLKRVLRLPLSGQTVENIRLKLVAPISMAMQRMASTTQLSEKPTLMFLVQKPQVLQADMAKVVASNHDIFVSRNAMAETEVIIR